MVSITNLTDRWGMTGGRRVHAKSRTVAMANARDLGATLLGLLRG